VCEAVEVGRQTSSLYKGCCDFNKLRTHLIAVYVVAVFRLGCAVGAAQPLLARSAAQQHQLLLIGPAVVLDGLDVIGVGLLVVAVAAAAGTKLEVS
jgi:hypothetical protein